RGSVILVALRGLTVCGPSALVEADSIGHGFATESKSPAAAIFVSWRALKGLPTSAVPTQGALVPTSRGGGTSLFHCESTVSAGPVPTSAGPNGAPSLSIH